MCNVADITCSAANSMHSATHKDHRGELLGTCGAIMRCIILDFW